MAGWSERRDLKVKKPSKAKKEIREQAEDARRIGK